MVIKMEIGIANKDPTNPPMYAVKKPSKSNQEYLDNISKILISITNIKNKPLNPQRKSWVIFLDTKNTVITKKNMIPDRKEAT